MTEEKNKPTIEDEAGNEDVLKPKGKYIQAIGRRKASTASIRIYKKGSGLITVNDKKLDDYFDDNAVAKIKQPLKLTSNLKEFNFYIKTSGGGKNGQAEAIRLGLCRALIKIDENLKPVIRSRGWMTRDARIKERKKPGLKKARRAPQWSKR